MTAPGRLTAKLHKILPSLTLELKAVAAAKRQNGETVHDFGLGETYGRLPAALREAGERAFREEHTEYTDPAGLPELREAVLDLYGYQDQYTIDNVIVNTGAKQGLLNALLATCNPADAIFLDAAPWVSYQPLATLSYAFPVMVMPLTDPKGRRLKMHPEDLLRNVRMRPHARALILNNPVNPTAQLYTQDELDAIVDLCVAHRIYLVLDRLYWRILYDGETYPEPRLDDATRPWIIQIDGLSKNYRRVGGLRIGFTIAPTDVARAMANIQSHITANAATTSQTVALAALTGKYDASFITELQGKRDLILQHAAGIPGVELWEVPATFYSFWDIAGLRGRRTPEGTVIASSLDVARYFLEAANTIVAPGAAFLQDDFLRLSFSTSESTIVDGMAAVRAAAEALTPADA